MAPSISFEIPKGGLDERYWSKKVGAGEIRVVAPSNREKTKIFHIHSEILETEANEGSQAFVLKTTAEAKDKVLAEFSIDESERCDSVVIVEVC